MKEVIIHCFTDKEKEVLENICDMCQVPHIWGFDCSAWSHTCNFTGIYDPSDRVSLNIRRFYFEQIGK